VLVVLDACVLYPPSLRDLLLTLAAFDAFDIRWSETILEELRRNVVADNPQVDPVRVSDHTLAEMRKHFPEAMVIVGQTEINRLDNHPKDRHVAAVGVSAGADAIVTVNVRDFRSRLLDEAGIAVMTPGQLVEEVLDQAPELVGYAV
jgi:predicted nucleic acid-binding protein